MRNTLDDILATVSAADWNQVGIQVVAPWSGNDKTSLKKKILDPASPPTSNHSFLVLMCTFSEKKSSKSIHIFCKQTDVQTTNADKHINWESVTDSILFLLSFKQNYCKIHVRKMQTINK
ncbi:hypothetical protein AMECASPLE_022933 [Ameca splendens]|uniref:Uncharacterized protein n=1 Tax=Ameca splendens TaxID=208324 RepID=A0ABV0ZDS6_9TELE